MCIAGKPGRDAAGLRRTCPIAGNRAAHYLDLRFVGEEEVPGLFASAAIVALPYREIDQSGVLMTAIGFDKPVIASRVGGLAETIQDHVHGRLFPAGDVEALTAALEEMLDPSGRRSEMEKAVRELRERLSWENSSARTIEVYKQLQSCS